MAFAVGGALIMGGSALASLGGGILSSNKASKAQKQQLAFQREQFNYAKEKDAKNEALYGGLNQQVVDSAKKGVTADLQGVSDRAAADVAMQYQHADDAIARSNQRLGINPNSGRAESTMRQTALSKALATAGNVTRARESERTNANNLTFNRQLQVAQMGNGQMANSANALTNAGNNIANSYGNQAAQNSATAAGYANTAVGFGLKAFDAYSNAPSTPTSVPNMGGITSSPFASTSSGVQSSTLNLPSISIAPSVDKLSLVPWS